MASSIDSTQVVPVLLGVLVALLGCVIVEWSKAKRVARIRIYDQLLPAVADAIKPGRIRKGPALRELRRASLLAGKREVELTHQLMDVQYQRRRDWSPSSEDSLGNEVFSDEVQQKDSELMDKMDEIANAFYGHLESKLARFSFRGLQLRASQVGDQEQG